MKGVVFNLLESFICEGWGDEAYEAILEKCTLETKEPFVGPGTYPDSDLFVIAGTTAAHLGVPLPDALRAFGKYCFPRLGAKVPALLERYDDPRELLKHLDGVSPDEMHAPRLRQL